MPKTSLGKGTLREGCKQLAPPMIERKNPLMHSFRQDSLTKESMTNGSIVLNEIVDMSSGECSPSGVSGISAIFIKKATASCSVP